MLSHLMWPLASLKKKEWAPRVGGVECKGLAGTGLLFCFLVLAMFWLLTPDTEPTKLLALISYSHRSSPTIHLQISSRSMQLVYYQWYKSTQSELLTESNESSKSAAKTATPIRRLPKPYSWMYTWDSRQSLKKSNCLKSARHSPYLINCW